VPIPRTAHEQVAALPSVPCPACSLATWSSSPFTLAVAWSSTSRGPAWLWKSKPELKLVCPDRRQHRPPL